MTPLLQTLNKETLSNKDLIVDVVIMDMITTYISYVSNTLVYSLNG